MNELIRALRVFPAKHPKYDGRYCTEVFASVHDDGVLILPLSRLSPVDNLDICTD